MYNQQLGLIALSRVTFKQTDGRLMVRDAPEVQEHLPQRAQRTQTRIARNAKSAKESKLKGKRRNLHHGDTETRRKSQNQILPRIYADGTDHLDGPNESLPSADGGSRPAAIEQTRRSIQHSAPSIQPDKQIRGSCQAAAEQSQALSNQQSAFRARSGFAAHAEQLQSKSLQQSNSGLSPHKTKIGFCGNPGVPPHRANCGRVGDPGLPPHRTKTASDGDPGLPPHCTKTVSDGDPGLPPHRTKTASDGDPGVECAKSIFFGVDGGGGYTSGDRRIG
jgi:hypothetical protein